MDHPFKRRGISLIVVVLVLGLPFAAFAAETAHDEHAGTPNPLTAGTIVNSIVTLIIFLVVLLVLWRFAWGPILAALQRREQFIRESLSEAKRSREEAEATFKAYTEKLEQARAEASAIVDEGRRDAEAVRQRINAEARSEAEAMLARAKREISLARDEAVQEIYHRTAEMATIVAARALRRELTSEEHERLLGRSLEEIRALGPNGRA